MVVSPYLGGKSHVSNGCKMEIFQGALMKQGAKGSGTRPEALAALGRTQETTGRHPEIKNQKTRGQQSNEPGAGKPRDHKTTRTGEIRKVLLDYQKNGSFETSKKKQTNRFSDGHGHPFTFPQRGTPLHAHPPPAGATMRISLLLTCLPGCENMRRPRAGGCVRLDTWWASDIYWV